MRQRIVWGSLSVIFSLLLGCGGGDVQNDINGAGTIKPSQPSNPSIVPKPPVLPNEPLITDAVYQDQPNIANCKTGTLSEATKQNMVKRLNLIRALHGLDSVSYDYEHDQEVMQAALIMSANKKLDHAPSSSWKCYSQMGYAGAERSNLYIEGGTALNNNHIAALQNDLTAWLIDTGVESLGHRRWLLNPFLAQIAYGSVAGKVDGQSIRSSALRVSYSGPARGFAKQDVIAYPMGDYPKQYFQQGAYLSVSILADQSGLSANTLVDFSKAIITIKPRGGVSKSPTQISSNNQGMGLPNHLQFKAGQLQENVIYDVHLDNVLINNVLRGYDYWFRLQ